jgi:hypothetical protein
MTHIMRSTLVLALGVVAAAGGAPAARAHFTWLATDAEGHALLFFGEGPADRTYHTPEPVAAAKVTVRVGDEAPQDVELAAVESDDFVGRKSEQAIPAGGVVESQIRYGNYHGTLLDYYAKHISSLDATAGKSALKLDATPRVTDDGIEVTVAWDGKPLAEAGVSLVEENGEMLEVKTNADGVAKFEKPADGLVGFLYSREDDEKGEVDGEEYTSTAAYGTLTVWLGEPSAKPQAAGASNEEASAGASDNASDLASLPEPVSSFGAAVADGWLYIYSGHTGEEHAHSIDNLSKRFCRIKLDGGQTWEELPMQTPLQGLPLVAHDGKLYRIGGLHAANKAGDDEDIHSVTEFASYDPATKEWTALAPLPEARSSHDAAVIGDKIYVVGGWTLSGDRAGTWLDTAWSFDLMKPEAGWQAIATPTFKRRALAVAEWNGKLVALGGMDDKTKISTSVFALDVATEQWTELADLPRSRMAGFGVSAWNLDGKLLVSGADGAVHQLADDGSKWETVGELATGRFFHRLMPGSGSTLLAVAGASMDDGHLASVESFSPQQQKN